MIVFNLQCSDCSHSFEGWFGSSKSCETQIKKKLVQCVSCGSSNITKELSRPNVSVKKTNVTPNEKVLRDFRNKVKEVNKFVKQNFEFVGDQFAYEARKIHYSKSNKKPVYGNATKEEVTDLSDEGIEVTSIPWIKEDN